MAMENMRGKGGRVNRLLLSSVVAASVLGATAACNANGGAGGTSTTGGQSTATATTAGQGTATSGTGTQSGTGTGTATGGSGSGSGSSNGNGSGNSTTSGSGGSGSQGQAAGSNACVDGDIATSLGTGGAATMHDGVVLKFRNQSSHSCTLQGYPGVAVVSGSSTLVNAQRELNGFIGEGNGQQLTSAPTVTLAPGATGYAVVEWVGNAGEACYAAGSGQLEVTPPNTRDSVSLESVTVGGAGMCAGFQVHPVVTGPLQLG